MYLIVFTLYFKDYTTGGAGDTLMGFVFPKPIVARFFVITSKTSTAGVGFRVELYGCRLPPETATTEVYGK
jgi:hypothetical protein